MEYFPVTVDKSHLITIGERLYSESIELIRELVNNTSDADATEVDIKMTDEFIEVKDNGVGMALEGLRQKESLKGRSRSHETKNCFIHSWSGWRSESIRFFLCHDPHGVNCSGRVKIIRNGYSP